MNPKTAHQRIKTAIDKGILIRPDVCEVCFSTGKEREDEKSWVNEHYMKPNGLGELHTRTYLVAHHWRGYDYPLDVWWVCYPCNRKLIKHDGSVSLDEARELIKLNRWFKHELDRRKSK